MAKTYWLKFGSGDPASFSGLTPTFTIFSFQGSSALAAPGITETPAGSGLYQFLYEPPASIIFKADAGSSVSSSSRYIVGALDPVQAVDERVGTTSDSFGSTAVDPSTVLGYVKRLQEDFEGAAVFTKATGTWQVYSRGSSTLLHTKTLTNTTTLATKA